MKYIINKSVVFNSDEGTLCLYENDQIITRLTKPATRLLLELIKNERNNVAREELLQNVWISYGFTASNASLNNYISELRKAFNQLGEQREIIVTIPKFGFRLESEVNIPEQRKLPAAPDIWKEKKEEHSTELTEVAQDKKPAQPDEVIPLTEELLLTDDKVRYYKILWPLLFIATVTIGAILVFSNSRSLSLYPRMEKISISGCNSYILGNVDVTDELLKKIDNFIKSEVINCQESDIYYLEERLDNKKIKSEFISACSKDAPTHYASCLNIKTRNARTQ